MFDGLDVVLEVETKRQRLVRCNALGDLSEKAQVMHAMTGPVVQTVMGVLQDFPLEDL